MPRSRSVLVPVLVVSLAMAGCASGDGDDEPGATTTTSAVSTTDAGPTTTAAGSAALGRTCAHQEREVTVLVRYPDDWHVNDGDATVACSAFDPEPVQLRRGTEFPPDLGAVVRVEPVGFDRASRPAGRVESEHRERIDGREAVRLEVVSTGEGLRPEGERTIRWVIEAGSGRSVIAHTSDVEGNDFEESTQVLDSMVRAFSIEPRA